MRVLVLGGSGFLGSHIADKFLTEKHEVSVFDLAPERFRRTPPAIRFHRGDFGNTGALDNLIATGFDLVIHCVSTTTPQSSNQSPEFDIQSNVIGTLSMLDSCVKHRVGKLVFLSSGGTVYGNVGHVNMVDESHAVRPMCSYAVSKLSIEYYLEIYKQLRGLDFITLRLANPYGERQHPLQALGAVTVFLHRTLRHQPIEIWGDGSVTRDFIHVHDVASAVYVAAVSKLSGVYNVGSGVGLSLRELLSRIAEVTGVQPSIKWTPPRPFDVPRIVLDSTKLRTATGWQCCVPLDTGIALTAAWLRETDV